MKRKPFMNGIKEHCVDNKMTKGVQALWKALEAQSKSVIKTQKDENKPKQLLNVYNDITQSIDDIVVNGGDQLKQHKAAIIEYFQLNGLDSEEKLKKMNQTQLANKIIAHCLKTLKPQNQIIEEIKEEKKESNDNEESEEESDYDDIAGEYIQKQMPTYINRAIWYRSDDESLESFFDNFVKKEFRRQLLLEDMRQEARKTHDDDKEKEDQMDEKQTKKRMPTHTVYNHYQIETVQKQESDDLTVKSSVRASISVLGNSLAAGSIKTMRSLGSIVSKSGSDLDIIDDHVEEIDLGYHIYSKGAAPITILKEQISDICVQQTPSDFVWTVWKSTPKKSRRIAQKGQKSFGYWEVLNSEQAIGKNTKWNGVPLNHLNAIFELLRVYYDKKIKIINKRNVRLDGMTFRLSSNDVCEGEDEDENYNDPLSDIYVGARFKPQKIEIDIFIHEDEEDNHYILT